MWNLNSKMSLRQAIEQDPRLENLYKYEYSYKYSSQQWNFKYLDDVLEEFGYKIINEDYIPWEYNDIKWYLECIVVEI